MSTTPETIVRADAAALNWRSSWLDALAFAAGLSVAWWAGWSSGDLVWSLWLSSLVVGYSTIVWMIAQPAAELGMAAWKDRALVESDPRMLWVFYALLVAGAGFFLAFFTFHFCFFHYGHSQILISFFPIDTGHGSPTRTDMSTYIEIFHRYWPFLPSAFLAHRAAFRRRSLPGDPKSAMALFGRGNNLGQQFSAPYRNVARMHFLIFFFFFAHFAKLENFAVYAVVYAAYFFPWRLLRRTTVQTAPTALTLP